MAQAQMSRFPIYDDESAPEAVAPLLKSISTAGGQLPNLLGALAGSPPLLRAFLRLRHELSHGALAAATRARIGIAVSAHFGATATATDHEGAARAAGIGLDEVARARRWSSSDPAHATLLAWLKPLLTDRGRVPAPLHESARESGWTDAQLLEAIGVLTLESLTAQVAVAGEIPPDGSSEISRQLRAVA